MTLARQSALVAAGNLRAIALMGVLLGSAGCGGNTQASVVQSPRFKAVTAVEVDRFIVDDGVVPPRAEVSDGEMSAACQTLIDSRNDVALSHDLMIFDDAGLLRSAELLDGGYSDSRAAIRAEELLVRGEDAAAVVAKVAKEQGNKAGVTADQYLRERSKPPSDGASGKYVVYATPSTTTEVLVIRMEIHPLVRAPHKWRADGTIELRRADGEAISIDSSWCR